MKLKYLFVVLTGFLCLVTISQIFTIPPYAGDIFNVYRSGYFRELEKSFSVITDAFIETKMLGKAEYAWVLLEDIGKKHAITIRVYDGSGRLIPAPGQPSSDRDNVVTEILGSMNPGIRSELRGRTIYTAIPAVMEDRCLFCHTPSGKNRIAGVLTFKRGYDAHVYYSSERIIIFSILTALLLSLLFLVIRWDPEKKVKELFDKM